jgi:hypothetical protein
VTYSVSKSSITVPGHSSKTVTVTMKVVPGELRHTLDPTMSATQSIGVDLPRQFVSDSSGHLTVTPQGKKELRVPVYGAAKPVSNTTATAQAGEIDLDGAGISQGTGTEAYDSMAAVLNYGTGSVAQPQCTVTIRANCWTNRSDRSGDIRYVGAASGDLGGDQYLWFGISTRQDWATNNSMEPYVDVDVDDDTIPDIEIYAENFASAQGRTDVFLAWTVDYRTGDVLDIEPVNFNFGDVDTNVFDTNVILLPMDLEFVKDGGPDLTGPDAPVTYWGATHNGYTGRDQDRTSAVEYNVGQPKLATEFPLYEDEDGAQIPVDGSGSALVFHLHGAAGHRDEVVDVPAPPPVP